MNIITDYTVSLILKCTEHLGFEGLTLMTDVTYVGGAK
jgi:hypothetical protein